jgi:hypothetical protein
MIIFKRGSEMKRHGQAICEKLYLHRFHLWTKGVNYRENCPEKSFEIHVYRGESPT